MSSINDLKIYFGDDYVINNAITIKHPTIGDIVDLNEQDYFSTVYTLAAIPSDMKSQLWDLGICWEDISDFELFAMLSRSLTVDRTKVFFGDLDFTRFELMKNSINDELVMVQQVDPTEDNPDGLIVIDTYIYLRIVTFIRKLHNIKPVVEKAGSKIVRQILIEEDRRKIAKVKGEEYRSQLLPMVSSLINCSEFKYGLKEVRQMPIYAFMDSIARIQIIKSSTALLQGCYGGMIDTSKIDKKELNWMRSMDKEA